MKKNKRVLILVCNGVEDIEFITVYDFLIRSSIDVDILNVQEEEQFRTSYGLFIKSDLKFKDIESQMNNYAGVFIPGGPGIKIFDEQIIFEKILSFFYTEGKVIGAISESPILLAKRGLLKKKRAICYNSQNLRKVLLENNCIIENANCLWGEACEVVIDKNIVTGLQVESSLPFVIRFSNIIKNF